MYGRASHLPAIAFVALILSILLLAPVIARPPWPASFLSDADLHDVQFIDANLGWAVGDRGVILHTSDGGVTWNYQLSSVGDSLYGVHFLDAKYGWAVGGYAVPHTQRGRGIVLRTDNGGRTWLVERTRSLPALRDVRFFDKQRGVAIGDASPLYPAGAFTTRDGGRTWSPLPVRTAHGWIAADFCSSGSGLLLGSAGHITTCEGTRCRARTTPPLPGGGHMRDIAWVDDQRAVAVGDAGTVWISENGGVRWQDVSQNLTGILPRTGIDFQTVTSDGTNVWVGGSPGSQLMHSSDGCQTWHAINLPATLPINKSIFDIASGRGCIVGPLGRILMSSDRGQSWQAVRGADRRLLALAVVEDPDVVPWTLLAQVAGGYGGRLRLVVPAGRTPALSMPLTQRLYQATLAVGGANANSISGSDVFEKVTAAVRTWQPALLITSGDAEFTKAVAEVSRSVDSSLAIFGAAQVAVSSSGSMTVASSEIADRLGASLGELESRAQAILGQSQSSAGERLSVRCYPLAGTAAAGSRVTSGLSQTAESASHRADQTSPDDRRRLEQNAQQHALLQQLIRRAAADPLRGDKWLVQVENMASRLSMASAATVLYDLSQQQFAAGNADAAIAALDTIATRHATSELSDAALRDGVLWLASREVAHRALSSPTVAAEKEEQTVAATPAVRPATFDGDSRVTPAKEESVRRGANIPLDRLFKGGPTIADQLRIRPASSQRPLPTKNPPPLPVDDSSPPVELQGWLERLGPENMADPDVQLAVESYRRRIHKPGARQQAVYQRLSRSLPGSWRNCASAELALLKPERDARKPQLVGRFGSRPHLDGSLDAHDKMTWPTWSSDSQANSEQHPAIFFPLEWKDINDRPLRRARDSVAEQNSESPNRRDNPSAIVMLAADSQFLYLAVRCQQQSGADYAFENAPRQHDADLTKHDRIDFLIDTDRDYSLAWRLSMDHRGWTGEALGLDTSWNPQWYVAAGQSNAEGAEWICEAAIAWKELADVPPTAESPWGLTVIRTLPDGQQQCWPVRTAMEPQRLEQAGLFHFAP